MLPKELSISWRRCRPCFCSAPAPSSRFRRRKRIPLIWRTRPRSSARIKATPMKYELRRMAVRPAPASSMTALNVMVGPFSEANANLAANRTSDSRSSSNHPLVHCMTISTGSTETYFGRNSLRMAVSNKATHALHAGALQPISTTTQWINEKGVDFVVRVLDGQAEKRASRSLDRAVYPQQNPFLPCDPDLFVADISATHRCLLNKFTVLTDHLLIVTRDFEHQETWLSRQDFQALWACMAEFDGLGFFNGGFVAGASQPHKHLQYVPFPLFPRGRTFRSRRCCPPTAPACSRYRTHCLSITDWFVSITAATLPSRQMPRKLQRLWFAAGLGGHEYRQCGKRRATVRRIQHVDDAQLDADRAAQPGRIRRDIGQCARFCRPPPGAQPAAGRDDSAEWAAWAASACWEKSIAR